MLLGAYKTRVLHIEHQSLTLTYVLLGDDHPVLGKSSTATLHKGHEVIVTEMRQDPLTPDDVIALGLRGEVLQTAADDEVNAGRFLANELPGGIAELLAELHHVDSVEDGQQESLGDSPNASPAVQRSFRARLAASNLQSEYGGLWKHEKTQQVLY